MKFAMFNLNALGVVPSTLTSMDDGSVADHFKNFTGGTFVPDVTTDPTIENRKCIKVAYERPGEKGQPDTWLEIWIAPDLDHNPIRSKFTIGSHEFEVNCKYRKYPLDSKSIWFPEKWITSKSVKAVLCGTIE